MKARLKFTEYNPNQKVNAFMQSTKGNSSIIVLKNAHFNHGHLQMRFRAPLHKSDEIFSTNRTIPSNALLKLFFICMYISMYLHESIILMHDRSINICLE